jgi:hypothetical protein
MQSLKLFVRALGGTGLVFIAYGCSSEPGDDAQGKSVATQTEQEQFAFPGDLTEPTTLTDDVGRVWNATPVRSFTEESKAPVRADLVPLRKGPTALELDLLDDDAYLERMKPLKVSYDSAGHAVEYALSRWDDKTRQTILAARDKQRHGWRMRSFGPGRVQEFLGAAPSAPPVAWTARPQAPQLLPSIEAKLTPTAIVNEPGCTTGFSCDSRQYVPHGEAFTWPKEAAQVHFGGGPGGLSGSGTNIGRYTAISAAHIFHTAGGGGYWYPTLTWKSAVVHTTSTTGGPDRWTVGYPYMNQSGIYGCYSVTIPASFITPGLSEGDFAIVEFTCGHRPGEHTGWVSPAIGNANDYTSASIQMQAYDGSGPYQLVASEMFAYPTMIRRSMPPGNAWIDPNYDFLLDHRLDFTGGASGGGLLQNLFSNVGDPTIYWVGDNSAGNSSYGTGRRLTWGSWGFIQAYSNEF